MSSPRFLADNDLMDQIVVGIQRREPAIQVTRLREVDLAQASDSAVLDYAAREGYVVVSHDINTMRASADQRIEKGEGMSGLILVHQRHPLAQTIEDLILIGVATDSTEWQGQIRFLPL